MFGHVAGEGGFRARPGLGVLAARVGDQQVDRGLAHEVGQRRALEGVDRRGNQTHTGTQAL